MLTVVELVQKVIDLKTGLSDMIYPSSKVFEVFLSVLDTFSNVQLACLVQEIVTLERYFRT